MRDLVVVVDVTNGFLNFGALADKKINKIIPNIERVIKGAKQKKMNIVAFKDCHKIGDEEFKTYPVHCLKGSKESEFIPELKKYEKDMLVIEKNTTNGFNTYEFKKIINTIEYDRVFVVGCVTDICVQDFVESYLGYINKNNKKTQIIVFEDASYTFDGPNHNAEEEHKKSISEMEGLGAKIAKVNNCENVKE